MADTKTNEMMNMPMISAGVMGVTGDIARSMEPVATPAPEAYDVPAEETVAVGAPNNVHAPADITVYADKITPVTYSSDNNAVAGFDIVFAVGINCGGGVTKTYQVVKRIGLDKCKLACEAECGTPVSVVEAKSEAMKEAAEAQKRRFRRLAGLE